jgi:hypothetical protein
LSRQRPRRKWHAACRPSISRAASSELNASAKLHPEQSTDALVLHHPEATYFNAK